MKLYYALSSGAILAGTTLAQKRIDDSGNYKGVWSFYKKWEVYDDQGNFSHCIEGYSVPTTRQRSQLVKKYKVRAADKAKNKMDLLIQEASEKALRTAECFKDDHINSLTISSMEFRSTGGGVDWNCDDPDCDIPVTLKGIWGYGCWCNFGGDLMKGKGTPMNPHDKVCQDMQLCLRCAEMDSTSDPSDSYICNVKTTQYNSLLQLGAAGLSENDNSINSGCTDLNNSDRCAAHVCACEVQMINDLLELVWSGYTHDTAPRHPDNPYGGSFDWESQCNTDPTGTIVKECCGKYPFRFPFNSLTKECCENNGVYETFNPLDQVCCASGVENVLNGGCN